MKVRPVEYILCGLAALGINACVVFSDGTGAKPSQDFLQDHANTSADKEAVINWEPLSSETPVMVPDVTSSTTDPFVSGLTLLYIPMLSKMVEVPADIGQGDRAISETIISRFREEYARALLSGVPLSGVLGADRLHRWTNTTRDGTVLTALVQNWKSKVPIPNSYGLPELVLAMDSADGDAVYCIVPPILELYSQGRGVGRTAGLAGYGKPLSGPFLMLQDASYLFAQRFSQGLIQAALDPQGHSAGQVILDSAPSETAVPPPAVGLLPDGTKSEAFVSAWFQAVDRGLPQDVSGNPDTPVVFMEKIAPETPRFALQTFDGGRWAIVHTTQTDAAPVLIAPPFSDRFVSGKTDPGLAMAKAFAIYGLPLAEAYAVPMAYLLHSPDLKIHLEKFIQSPDPYIPLLVQRFQRGLWVAVPKTAVQKAD